MSKVGRPRTDQDTADTIAANIRRVREECIPNRLEFSRKSGISANTLAAWESGKGIPTLDRAYRFARFVGVSLDSLVREP